MQTVTPLPRPVIGHRLHREQAVRAATQDLIRTDLERLIAANPRPLADVLVKVMQAPARTRLAKASVLLAMVRFAVLFIVRAEAVARVDGPAA